MSKVEGMRFVSSQQRVMSRSEKVVIADVPWLVLAVGCRLRIVTGGWLSAHVPSTKLDNTGGGG